MRDARRGSESEKERERERERDERKERDGARARNRILACGESHDAYRHGFLNALQDGEGRERGGKGGRGRVSGRSGISHARDSKSRAGNDSKDVKSRGGAPPLSAKGIVAARYLSTRATLSLSFSLSLSLSL